MDKKEKLNLIKELRERTLAGLSSCREALESNNFDLEAATNELRRKGKVIAEQRGDRDCRFYVYSRVHKNNAVAFSLGCETDFVARSDLFRQLVDELFDSFFEGHVRSPTSQFQTWALVSEGRKTTIEERIKEVAGLFGENLKIGRVEFLSVPGDGKGKLFSYVHGGNRFAAIASFENTVPTDVGEAVTLNLVVYKPLFAEVEMITEDVAAACEKQIRETLPEGFSSKPEAIQQRILESRRKKEFTELTLLDRPNVTNEKQSVREMLKANNGKLLEFYVIGED